MKDGQAEGEAVVTGTLFDRAKKGEAWAVCFYLKARCGCRDSDPPGGVSVSVSTGYGGAEDADWVEEQKKLIRLLTVQERKVYLSLLDRAATRQKGQEQRSRKPTTEMQSQPGQANGEPE
jgi:hypothetical protein